MLCPAAWERGLSSSHGTSGSGKLWPFKVSGWLRPSPSLFRSNEFSHLDSECTCMKRQCSCFFVVHNNRLKAERNHISFHCWWWCCSVTKSCLTLSLPRGRQPTRLLCPWDVPGRNTGMGCHFLLQGIFQIQGSNLRLLLGRWILYHGATREAPHRLSPFCCYML